MILKKPIKIVINILLSIEKANKNRYHTVNFIEGFVLGIKKISNMCDFKKKIDTCVLQYKYYFV